ncbi:type II secretion system F family protein [Vibrio sp. Of7-15]|uniref:type II secretion system F family protein n=1 Tax=Vibrio sp. Of7-15 TaxID=2724879 RepID=UPI001EF28303|nr:type II secretion system F family protein [Vibrio sp. Of7-15]MCG7496165.1 type II secretion system F family protein [Vibrio sp. Of7-15]
MTTLLWLAAFLFGISGLLAVSLRRYAEQQDKIASRIEAISRNTASNAQDLAKQNTKTKAEMLLISAGFYSPKALRYFWLVKGSVMLFSGMAWLYYRQFDLNSSELAKAIVFAISGGLLVERFLHFRAKQIIERIASATPDALDLMVICIESGLTIEATFAKVGKELKRISPELSRELLITEAELRLLDSRKTAFINMQRRVKVQEIDIMASTLIQSDQYGSAVAETLRVMATDSRQHRYLRLEEKVGKLPAQMSLPLVGLVMVPVVVLIAAPTILKILTMLGV